VLNSGHLGTTIYVQLSASTIKKIGNGYFSYIGEASQSPIQTLYIVDDGFLSPVSSATPDPPPVVPSTMPTITYNSDGSVTIGDNSVTLNGPGPGNVNPALPTQGLAFCYIDPSTGQIMVLTQAEAIPILSNALTTSSVYGDSITDVLLSWGIVAVQSTTVTVPTPPSDMSNDPSGSTGAGNLTITHQNDDGSTTTTTVNEDGSISVTTTAAPPPSSSGSSGSGGNGVCTPFHF
jgi:hypothetical protein